MATEQSIDTQEIAARVVARAAALGADQASAEVSADSGLSVAVRCSEVESIEHTEERVLSLSVWTGHSRGCAASSDLSEAALEATVRAALSIAKITPPDPMTGLPDEQDLQTVFRPLDLYHPFGGSVQEAVSLAAAVEKAAMDTSASIVNSEGSRFSTSTGSFTLANSHGFCAGYAYSRHDLDCAPVAQDKNGMQTSPWWTQGRRMSELTAPETLGRQAAERTLARLGARRLSNRTCRVLFDAPVAIGLLAMLEELLSGKQWYRRASVLTDSFKRLILPPHIQVVEDPYRVGAIGSGVFDDEGCAGRRRAIVESGRVAGIFLNTYSARLLGMRTTGNAGGAYNLTLKSERTAPGDNTTAMLEALGTGLWVTDVFGAGLNPMTGEYSRGINGFWVENGCVAFPVGETTIAGNLLSMMQAIEAVGADQYSDGQYESGSLLIKSIHVAGH